MRKLQLLLTILVMIIIMACGAYAGGATLFAKGATFPYPLYQAYFKAINEETGSRIMYEALGSGAGVRALLEKRVDFGATDYFLSDSVLHSVDGEIIHIPTSVGAVVLSYNLPGNPQIYLTPELIEGIFLGEISQWNDSRIQQVNPNLSLPSMQIIVVHRYDKSGTTHMFSDYLCKVSPLWRRTVGLGKQLPFPVGYGAEGNSGVSGLIRRAEGAIGYLELAYVEEAGLPKAAVMNKAGRFVIPDTRTVSLAANVEMPPDTRISITNTDADEGYPISGYTWLIFYKQQAYQGRSQEQAKALVQIMKWILHQGQAINSSLHYAPLPEAAREKALALIDSTRYGSTRVAP